MDPFTERMLQRACSVDNETLTHWRPEKELGVLQAINEVNCFNRQAYDVNSVELALDSEANDSNISLTTASLESEDDDHHKGLCNSSGYKCHSMLPKPYGLFQATCVQTIMSSTEFDKKIPMYSSGSDLGLVDDCVSEFPFIDDKDWLPQEDPSSQRYRRKMINLNESGHDIQESSSNNFQISEDYNITQDSSNFLHVSSTMAVQEQKQENPFPNASSPFSSNLIEYIQKEEDVGNFKIQLNINSSSNKTFPVEKYATEEQIENVCESYFADHTGEKYFAECAAKLIEVGQEHGYDEMCEAYVLDGFLDEALGNEQFDYSSNESQLNSTFTSNSCSVETGVSGDDLHDASLYHTVTQYRSSLLSRQKVRPSILSNSASFILDKKPQFFLSSEKEKHRTVQSLLEQATVQQRVKEQANKARSLCSTSKIFKATLQHVECEKILLTSTYRYQVLLQEASNLRKGNSVADAHHIESGSVSFFDLRLLLRESYVNAENETDGCATLWFLCVMSHHENVLASQVVSELEQGHIHFPGTFTFCKLHNDFEVRLNVYSLTFGTTPNPIYTKKLNCCDARRQSQLNFRTKGFILEGTLQIHLCDINRKIAWELREVSTGSLLTGKLFMSTKSSVDFKIEVSGFLDIVEDKQRFGAWDRKWFFLDGHMLKFWNSPLDKDSKPPVGELDLLLCSTQTVKAVNRSQCARPRTFSLEIQQKFTGKTEDRQLAEITRYFLSADTGQAMVKWCSLLNQILKLLREWNVLL